MVGVAPRYKAVIVFSPCPSEVRKTGWLSCSKDITNYVCLLSLFLSSSFFFTFCSRDKEERKLTSRSILLVIVQLKSLLCSAEAIARIAMLCLPSKVVPCAKLFSPADISN